MNRARSEQAASASDNLSLPVNNLFQLGTLGLKIGE